MFRTVALILLTAVLGSCAGDSQSNEAGQKYSEACYASSSQMMRQASSELGANSMKLLLEAAEDSCSCEARKFPDILTHTEFDDLTAMIERDTRNNEIVSTAKIELFEKLPASTADRFSAAVQSCN